MLSPVPSREPLPASSVPGSHVSYKVAAWLPHRCRSVGTDPAALAAPPLPLTLWIVQGIDFHIVLEQEP